MILMGHLEKLLEVISGLPWLVLQVVLRGDDELLIRVTDLLVVVTLITDGSDRDSLGLPLQPPLVAFGTALCVLSGHLERRPSTTTEALFPAVLDENGLNHLFTRGVPSGDVKELLCGLQLVMAELMHQDSVVCDRLECRDDVGIVDLGELMTLLGETPDVIP
jgi:hypothetical protein